MANFNERIADLAGVNAAIVADLLESLMRDGYEVTEQVTEKFGKRWCRCSMRTMTAYCPYLSIHQVEHAVWLLRAHGIVTAARFSRKGFDHTNWYAFTEYGRRVMEMG